MTMRTEAQLASKTAKVGYALWTSGIMAALFYLFQSWVTEWEHFSILVAATFPGVAVFGLVLLLKERPRTFKMDRVLFIGSILVSIGMMLLVSGLAWLDRMPGTAAWILTFGGGPALILSGITIILTQNRSDDIKVISESKDQ